MQEGIGFVEMVLRCGSFGLYQIKVVIVVCYCEGILFDWLQILLLYDELLVFVLMDVVCFNWVVVLVEVGFLSVGFKVVEVLEVGFLNYQFLYVVKVDFLVWVKRNEFVWIVYEKVIVLVVIEVDWLFFICWVKWVIDSF